jgi:hypothetical protein
MSWQQKLNELCPENGGKPHWYDGGLCYVCGADEEPTKEWLAARLAEAERLLRAVEYDSGGEFVSLIRYDEWFSARDRLLTPDSASACRYPDCVDNGPDGKCTDWLTGVCKGPAETVGDEHD